MKPTIIIVFLLAFFEAAAQPAKPSLRMKVGQVFYLGCKTVSTSVQNVRGAENKTSTTVSFSIAFAVAGCVDTVYELDAHYQSLEMKIRLADTTLAMSSLVNIKRDTPSVIMTEIVNKPFKVKITTGGKVLSVSRLNDLITGAFGDFPSIDSLKRKKVAGQFIQAFGEGVIKGILGMGIGTLPAKPVAPNNHWDENTMISSPAVAAVHSFYTLTDATPDFYFIHGEGLISAEKTAIPSLLDGMPMRYEVNGSVLNELKIDRKSGWITELKLKQLVEESVEILDNPKIPGGLTIPMMFTTEMTVNGKP